MRWCFCQRDCKVETSFWGALLIEVYITVNEMSLGGLHY